jgi:hypothetical protein
VSVRHDSREIVRAREELGRGKQFTSSLGAALPRVHHDACENMSDQGPDGNDRRGKHSMTDESDGHEGYSMAKGWQPCNYQVLRRQKC